MKQGINTAEKDPRVSHFASEVKRKEALNAEQMDLEFLKALQDIPILPPQPPIDTNPNTNPFQKSELTVIHQSGFVHPPKQEPEIPPQPSQPTQNTPELQFHKISGWGIPGRGAFDSLPILPPLPITPSPGFNMSRNFDQQPDPKDSPQNLTPSFGQGVQIAPKPVIFPPQPQRPQLSDAALVALLRRVGI